MESSAIVFFDFDNTISCGDALGAVVEKFSINQDWEILEDEWRAGKIGSRECLEGQLNLVRVSERDLTQYLETVRLDPAFGRLLKILKTQEIPYMVLSDSFSFIIQTILKQHGIQDMTVIANEVRFVGERLIPSFPHSSKDCRRCAHCKKVHLLKYPDKKRIYVGDGFSDRCPALVADLVFAKEGLAAYLTASQKKFTPFQDLGSICNFFEEASNLNLLQKA